MYIYCIITLVKIFQNVISPDDHDNVKLLLAIYTL